MPYANPHFQLWHTRNIINLCVCLLHKEIPGILILLIQTNANEHYGSIIGL